MLRRVLLVTLLLTVPLVGCLGSGPPTAEVEMASGYPTYKATDGLYHFEWTHDGMGPVHAEFAPGALSSLTNDGSAPLTVNITALAGDREGKVLLVQHGAFSLASEIQLAPGTSQTFLPPPSTQQLQVLIEGTAARLSPKAANNYQRSWNQIVSGENVWNLSAHQEATFPHREPGGPNYWKSIEYFQTYFEDLGYTVEVDPYGTHDLTQGGTLCVPARGTSYCPESLANVVAVKEGTNPDAGTIFVAGGHFDMVNATTHAAFDDTSGTVATLELARVMAAYEFEHTLMFGLWGGEENGILGSQFWVRTHPQEVAQIKSYWNLDVVGMSWPAPKPDPDPVVIAAGPDAPGGQGGATADPVSAELLGWAQTLQRDWFGYPDEVNGSQVFIYEGVASGQATGYTGVNAQSDHTPFMAAGVPSYFIFNGDALDMPVRLHTESDTLNNMTKYALFGLEADLEDPTWPSDAMHEEAKDWLARSWEANLFFPLYHAILVDLGIYDPPNPEAPQGLATLP